MTRFQSCNRGTARWAVAVLAIASAFPGVAAAQPPAAQQATQTPAGGDKALADQLRQLRDQVSRLEKTVQQQGTPQPNSSSRPQSSAQKGMQGMGMHDSGEMSSMSGNKTPDANAMKSNTPMMDNDKSEMSSISQAQNQPMSGMDAMGKVSGAPQMAAQSALPGFPGASHLYHIGATGFFLDHPDHVTLTDEQRTRLSQIREKALLEKSSAQRKVDEAEQQLFTLTEADQPNQAEIQTKIREIAELGAQQRLAYIQAVGEAAQVLTDEQRRQLVGQASMPQSSK